MAKNIALGNKAFSFHDQALGITICRGEVISLSERQLQSKHIRQALNGGHLRFVNDDEIKKYTDEDIEKLDKKLMNALRKGVKSEKVAKDFSLEEAKLLATRHEIEVEATDTPDTIITAIAETLEENK